MNWTELITLIITFVNSAFVIIFSVFTLRKERLEMSDELWKMYYELCRLKEQYRRNQGEANCGKSSSQDIDNLQLRMKDTIISLEKAKLLTHSQKRLLALCYEEFLYYDKCEQMWDSLLSDFSNSNNPSLLSEYQRNYGQFLYKINKVEKGHEVFSKSVALPISDDGRRYIVFSTYIVWIDSIINNYKEYSDDLHMQIEDINREINDLRRKADLISSSISDENMRKATDCKLKK